MDDTVKSANADHHLPEEIPLQRPDFLLGKLQDAELMLAFAAESGVELDPKIRAQVWTARVAETNGQWTVEVAEDLLSAITTLAEKLYPVTVESVKLCPNSVQADRMLRFYRRVAIFLALVIMPFSFATFVGGELTKTINQDSDAGNKLAVTVGSVDWVGAPLGQSSKERTEAIRTLQEFAANARSLLAHAMELDRLLLANTIAVPYAGENPDREHDYRKEDLEIPPNLTTLSGKDLSEVATKRISVYQGIRYFAQTVQGTVTVIYGAFGTCVLPVLYALLGSAAYLLREFEQQLRTRTLTQTDAHVAHFVVAGISGAVVGLFSNFSSGSTGGIIPFNFGQSSLASPLATAFLVGYAVDVFFSFLEGVIQSFNRSRSNAAVSATSRTAPVGARAVG